VSHLAAAALLAFSLPARAQSSVVFQAWNFPGCQPGLWRSQTGSVTGSLLGFNDCAHSSGFQGAGTPNDPYRVALDGQHESIDIDGLQLTTQTDYTVRLWFRVTSHKNGRMMLVDSWYARSYAPLRMMVADSKPACSIEMPFPDRVYLASSTRRIAPSSWHEAVCRFRAESRRLSLFLDGRVEGSTRIPPGTIRSSRVSIGASPAGDAQSFTGDIATLVFAVGSEEPDAIQARCQEESKRFAGATCRK
jgi:hypothetical protein